MEWAEYANTRSAAHAEISALLAVWRMYSVVSP